MMNNIIKLFLITTAVLFAGSRIIIAHSHHHTTTTTTTSTTTTTTPSTGAGGSSTTTTTMPTTTTTTGSHNEYAIISVGIVGGQSRIVTIEGVRRMTWADYALWSDNNRAIYFKDGETFNGKVHANTELYFDGSPEFAEKVTSAASTYGGSTNQCVFEKGLYLGAGTDTMASVSFTNLKNQASMIVTGATTITIVSNKVLITNERNGWNNYTSTLPPEATIYIQTATTGTSSTRPGDASVSGLLDGRLTIVSEHDINITSNITYAVHPTNNSDDALGLISQHNIVVKPSCPNDTQIFAHMMATGLDTATADDGSFGVENYDTGSARGNLIVYGGIVQSYRGAVGTFNTTSGTTVTGYAKQYTYDTRFLENPPPHYPPLSNNLKFGTWRDEYK